MFISARSKHFINAVLLVVLILSASVVRAQTQGAARIVSAIKNEVRITVSGSTPRLVKASVDAGRMAGGQNLGRMLLLLSPTAEQDKAAAELVSALHDSSSPSYHKWLTPAQYGQQFGVATEDADQGAAVAANAGPHRA